MSDQEPSPTIAVVGVGNEIMSDDGVGPHVIRRLGEKDIAPIDEVALADAGTTGFLALEAMSGAREALVVDAISTGATPGTIHEYRCVDGIFETEAPEMTMHDVSFTEALQFGREAYELPEEIRIVGIEPATVEPGLELSQPVEAAVPDVIDMITSHIFTIIDEQSPANNGVVEQ